MGTQQKHFTVTVTITMFAFQLRLTGGQRPTRHTRTPYLFTVHTPLPDNVLVSTFNEVATASRFFQRVYIPHACKHQRLVLYEWAPSRSSERAFSLPTLSAHHPFPPRSPRTQSQCIRILRRPPVCARSDPFSFFFCARGASLTAIL